MGRHEGGRGAARRIALRAVARSDGGASVDPVARGVAQGGLWVGTDGRGLELVRDGADALFDVKHGFPNDIVRAVYEDSHGTTWVGTYANGLTRVAGGKVQQLGEKDGLPNVVATGFAEAKDGSIWIGTDGGGIVHALGDRFTVLSTKDGLSNDVVQALYADGDDLWIGTYGGGLARLRGGKLGQVTTKEGLFNDVVFAIVDDGAGDLWMTCNKGVFHAKKSELSEVIDGKRPRVTSQALGTLDGMRSSECNGGGPAGARSRDGKLWFPTVAGLAMIDPARTKRNDVPPPVKIEEVDVDRAPVDLAKSGELAPGSREFAFVYTALSFTTPEKVRFKYKLEGFDKDWVDAGGRRVAYYTNLAPRAYRFRVVAANDDGVWNERGASVAFSLLPHFWETGVVRRGVRDRAGADLGRVGSAAAPRAPRPRRRARGEGRRAHAPAREGRDAELQGAFKALAEKDARLHEDSPPGAGVPVAHPAAHAERRALRIRALYPPADLVGGDIYDVCEVGDGHYRIFVADTTGHGVQASLRTMVLKNEIHRLKLDAATPGRAPRVASTRQMRARLPRARDALQRVLLRRALERLRRRRARRLRERGAPAAAARVERQGRRGVRERHVPRHRRRRRLPRSRARARRGGHARRVHGRRLRAGGRGRTRLRPRAHGGAPRRARGRRRGGHRDARSRGVSLRGGPAARRRRGHRVHRMRRGSLVGDGGGVMNVEEQSVPRPEVLYEVGDPGRAGARRAGSKLESSSASKPRRFQRSLHDEIARAATTLLSLASEWATAGKGARLAIRIESRGGACTIDVEAKRAAGRALTLSARVAV